MVNQIKANYRVFLSLGQARLRGQQHQARRSADVTARSKVNFVAIESSGILFGFLLRLALPHSLNKPTWRLLYCLVLGITFLLFMIGKSTWVVLLQVLLCYVIMKYFPQRHMQLIVFFLALGYMLILYVVRFMKNTDMLCYDETFPLMVTTQKVTTLAFGLSDWHLMQKGKKMGTERQKWAVRKMPGLLEYLAFTLSFQGVLAGPFCHYNLYRAFIEGNTKARLSEETEHPVRYEDDPSTCLRTVMTKVFAVAFWTCMTGWVKPLYPETLNADPAFIASHGFLFRVVYLYVSTFLNRCKYFVTWILADAVYNASGLGYKGKDESSNSDAVYNASGLGYEGKDENGKPRWTGMTNVFVIKLETASSLKIYLDNWNIMTTHWLRHVCYTRAPFMNTLLTFILSALWHGIHAGYYITFIAAAFFVLAARKMRATVRPMFQGSRWSRVVYDMMTTLATHLSMPFLVFSFLIHDLQAIWQFHKSFYFAVYIIVLSICIALPSRKRASPGASSPKKEPAEAGDKKLVSDDNAQHVQQQQQQQQQKHHNGNNNMQHHTLGAAGDAFSEQDAGVIRRGVDSTQMT
ncbi:membrane-bound o-acyltransferase domain-containing protein 2 [Plakobranchus ocellatus]|uniref:Membrane-bound o-acyltransferase domain-containing protein 2 n=1 Tax=Plakobranchus ocellatus TaxID=259542 RepID=A0AAV4AZ26_9GAST|nr:membrane-bound o-acyltransferase domain-containing protein 2 [Plakobranchus ocellatus]